MCRYNKQVIDSLFLDTRGQSASYGNQQLNKIEAAFRGWGVINVLCSLVDAYCVFQV